MFRDRRAHCEMKERMCSVLYRWELPTVERGRDAGFLEIEWFEDGRMITRFQVGEVKQPDPR